MTFNKQNTYDWFRKRVYKLEETQPRPDGLPRRDGAAREWGDKIPIGLFYRNPNPRPSLDTQDPGLQSGLLVQQPLGVSQEQRRNLIGEFM